jgi:hypothetical protein
MTLIDLGDFKLRFDPKEVRINIDGDLIDIGARKELPQINNDSLFLEALEHARKNPISTQK